MMTVMHMNKLRWVIRNNGFTVSSGTLSDLTGTPAVVWRNAGQKEWTATSPQTLKKSAGDNRFSFALGVLSVTGSVETVSAGALEIKGMVTNTGPVPVELARFSYLDGVPAPEVSFLPVIGTTGIGTDSDHIVRDTSTLKSKEGKSWYHKKGDPPWGTYRLDDPVHLEDSWALSYDAGILLDNTGKTGWVLGTTGPAKAFGEIGFRNTGKDRRWFASQLLDNILLEPGEIRELERLWMYAGDWQRGLEALGKRVTEFQVPRPLPARVSGYCSYYLKTHRVTPEDMLEAAGQGDDFPANPGMNCMLLDDGYQVIPGNWDPNKRFEKTWQELPDQMEKKGVLPGIWVGPTLIGEDHPLIAEHPDVIQRMPDGSPASYARNFGWGWLEDPNAWKWGEGKVTHHLEPDHEVTGPFIAGFLRKLKEYGWKYFKLDFIQNMSTARKAADRSKTAYENIGDIFRICRKALGDDMPVNACTAIPLRSLIGTVDYIRIAGDMWNRWSFLKSKLPQHIIRTLYSGTWYQPDPDVFFLRKNDKEGFGLEQAHMMAATSAMLGGSFMTGDLPSMWDEDDRRIIDTWWPLPVPERIRTVLDADGMPMVLVTTYPDGTGRVLFYNWGDEVKDVSADLGVLLPDVALDFACEALYPGSEADRVLTDDTYVTFSEIPGRSARGLKLRF